MKITCCKCGASRVVNANPPIPEAWKDYVCLGCKKTNKKVDVMHELVCINRRLDIISNNYAGSCKSIHILCHMTDPFFVIQICPTPSDRNNSTPWNVFKGSVDDLTDYAMEYLDLPEHNRDKIRTRINDLHQHVIKKVAS